MSRRLRHNFIFDGYARAIGRHRDGAYPPGYCEDVAGYDPHTGLYVADGVGSTIHPLTAARGTVREVRARTLYHDLGRMPLSEAVDCVRSDVLPYADKQLADVRSRLNGETASTTLGAALFALDGLVIVGVGDTRAYLYAQLAAQGGGINQKFGPITPEQGNRQDLYNTINGTGRPEPGQPGKPDVLFTDQVYSLPYHDKMRLLIVSDGVTGDAGTGNRMPDSPDFRPLEWSVRHGNRAYDVAENVLSLPEKLAQMPTMVPVAEPDGSIYEYFYTAPEDDRAAGALLVHSAA